MCERWNLRQDVCVPKRLELRVSTPLDVYAASQAFGTEVRIHLIRHFARSPGRQVDAMRSLGVDRAAVSLNVKALLETGVLVGDEGTRSRTYHVDHERLTELVKALHGFTFSKAASEDQQ